MPNIANYVKILSSYNMADYVIRFTKDKDIPQVAEIDREAFPGESMFHSYASYKQDLDNPATRHIVACTELNQQGLPELPWFKRLFRSHRSHNEGKSTEYIVGFASLWLMLKDAHITTIATRNNYRRIGLGEGLLISIIELAIQLNANMVTLEVRVSNVIAQSLYKKYGFQTVGKRIRYYTDNGEDAILMSTDNINSAPFQAHFQQLKKAYAQRYHEISMQL